MEWGEHNFFPFPTRMEFIFIFLTQSTLRKGLYHGKVLSENSLKGLIHISESNSRFSMDVAFFISVLGADFRILSFSAVFYIRLLS